MYRASDIRQLHIEASTQCNAECPMCCRNLKGRTSPGLVEQSMSLATFADAIPIEMVRQLEILDVCGAYGDPAMAPDLIPIAEYVRRLNPGCQIRVFSNGGLRDERWWSRLATVGDVTVVFAIDGLATNQVYRRRVGIDKVLRNTRTYIGAGGRAQWDYIVFEHNEHEIDAARRMSESLGFETFAVKRTSRFLKPLYEPSPEVADPEGIDSFPIHDRDGQIIGQLRPPRAAEYVNEVLLWISGVEDKATYLQKFFDSCRVRCSALDSRSLFVSVAGHLYPCCWTYVQATLPSVYGRGVHTDPQVRDLMQANGGVAGLDATARPVDDILGGDFFAAVERSWSASSVASGKLKVCARVCGEGFNAYRKQFERSELVP